MGVKYSGLSTVYTTCRADTSAHLRDDLDAALVGAGWTVDRSITNGKVYVLASPQGLQCKCKIQDTGRTQYLGPHVLDLRFLSVDETKVGGLHDLVWGNPAASARGYTVQVGPCQYFGKLLGQGDTATAGGLGDGTSVYAVSGGIPYVAAPVGSACAITGAEVVTELWWSSGAHTGHGGFRTQRATSGCYTVCRNGVLQVAPPADPTNGSGTEEYDAGPLQLLCQTPCYNVDFGLGHPEKVLRYKTWELLSLDALLVWRWRIIGQLWDAFCKSAPTALDDVITSTESDAGGAAFTATWEAYNYGLPPFGKGAAGTWFNTLYLLKGALTPAGGGGGSATCNYAY